MKKIDEKVLNSNIFKVFLENKENHELYLSYLVEPTNENAEKLNNCYKVFERHIIATAYLKKVIYFEARRFDSKIRQELSCCDLNLDSPIQDGIALIDTIADESNCHVFDTVFEEGCIDDVISDDVLLKSLQLLTPKQKQVLYYRYVAELSEKEIANIFGVSQQAVSKMLRKSLNTLKCSLI